MKLFQCIHRYPPHIPGFEKRYQIREKGYSFDQIVQLLLKDGYASTYILNPEHIPESDHELFFTIWDYEYLQHQWASENGLKTKNLDEIKLAQLEAFQPDVFYNHSPRYDNNFIEKLPKNSPYKKICWDAVVSKYPPLHEAYEARLTLLRNFVDYWTSKGLYSAILRPSFIHYWDDMDTSERPIDILFYGQYLDIYYNRRNERIQNLLKWLEDKPYNAKIHLQYAEGRKPLINKRIWRRLTRFIKSPPKIVREMSLPPIYGDDLYTAIGHSKIVLNWFGDYNGLYHDNMRNFETMSGGALLISEDGIYPKGLIPEDDFLIFRDTDEMFSKIDFALSLPDQGRSIAERTRGKVKSQFSKSRQWNSFMEVLGKL